MLKTDIWRYKTKIQREITFHEIETTFKIIIPKV